MELTGNKYILVRKTPSREAPPRREKRYIQEMVSEIVLSRHGVEASSALCDGQLCCFRDTAGQRLRAALRYLYLASTKLRLESLLSPDALADRRAFRCCSERRATARHNLLPGDAACAVAQQKSSECRDFIERYEAIHRLDPHATGNA